MFCLPVEDYINLWLLTVFIFTITPIKVITILSLQPQESQLKSHVTHTSAVPDA